MINSLSRLDHVRSHLAMQGMQHKQKKDALKQSCAEAEGVFASILLKEGLKPMLEETQEGGSHMGGLMELTIEQMARDIGKQGSLGIADAFYQQLSAPLLSTLPTKATLGGNHDQSVN